jgi:anthranilate synthase component 1|tara:strand:+ start:372 stop:1760 length:1389 start_codon:yes stop_codon:yes gene_type:complete
MYVHGKKVFLDTENTITIYNKLANKFKDVSILESVIGGDNKGRYSIILFNILQNVEIFHNYVLINNQKKKIKSPDSFIKDIYKNLKIKTIYDQNIPLPIFIGNVSFDLCKFTLPKLSYKPDKNEIGIPLAHFVKPRNLIIIDNVLNETHLIEVSNIKKNPVKSLKKLEKILKEPFSKNKKLNFSKPKKFKNHIKKEEFIKRVKEIKRDIKVGEIFQAVLSQRFSNDYLIDPFNFYRALRSINPSPYLVFLNLKNYQIICSSPETMIKVKNKEITLRPIAGTRRRGKNEIEDNNLKNELLKDKKELAEHLMLVDLGRNDVGQISKNNTVKVTEQNIIEYYSHVMHIVSNVTGELKNNLTPIDVLFAGLPAGTVSGAPKIRALEILEKHEDINREFYSGSVFYLDANGDMDSCINLRTAMIKNKKIYAQSGAGIVFDSIPENEHIECINKASALFEAYNLAHNI